jgi:hypothetical protein
MRRRTQPPPAVSVTELEEWVTGELPEEWFSSVEVLVDDDEILFLGTLAGDRGDDFTGFREETRGRRIDIASKAEGRWQRKVAWGVRSGDTVVVFTHLAIPAMTRLRIKERLVLDTLVDAGVARSRADALAWCVRLVGRNIDPWLEELREALEGVEDVRRRGPDL